MNIIKDYLPINMYSRPGSKRPETKVVTWHWVQNPMTSAKFNRDWFASAPQRKKYGSTHYLIDLNGDIINDIPDEEVSHDCGSAGKIDPVSGKLYTDLARKIFGKYTLDPWTPSYTTISIELCHLDWNGKFTDATLQSLIELTVSLFNKYDSLIDPMTQILRHHDVVGWKDCPKWFVDHPEDFEEKKRQVLARLA